MKLHVAAGSGVSEGDPLGLLVDCHGRIRQFTALAARLAASADAPAVLRAEAAAGLCRYFTVAFPLHSGDEEELLVPRLRRSAEAEVQRALDTLLVDHRACDVELEALLPAWRALAGSARGSPERDSVDIDSFASQALCVCCES